MVIKGKIIGIDFGTKKIGLAVTDETRTISQPYCVIKREGTKKDIEKIMNIAKEQKAELFVIGVPYDMNDNISNTAEKAMNFAKKLQELSGIKVDFIDESFSSVNAESIMLSGGLSRSKIKGKIDKISASIILNDYLKKHYEK